MDPATQTISTIRSYAHGLDLAGRYDGGSLSGAGGIGGVLGIADETPTHAGVGDPNAVLTLAVCYDHNGNVGQLLDLAGDPNQPAELAARYDYDVYGNTLWDVHDPNASGPYAAENPLRFSTKTWDNVTGWGYWGYRYYSARLGRWVSRDPIGEAGHELEMRSFRVSAMSHRWRAEQEVPLEDMYAYTLNHVPSYADALGDTTIRIKPLDRVARPQCGDRYFMHWDFVLEPKAPCDGYFVQRIDVWCVIGDGCNCPDTLPLEPAYSYWEAFPVKEGSRTYDGRRGGGRFTDEFGWVVPRGTCGHYAQIGEVRFYCKRDTGDLGANWQVGQQFGEGRCGTTSGTAQATSIRPEFWIGPPRAVEVRNAGVSWNCCDGNSVDAFAYPD